MEKASRTIFNFRHKNKFETQKIYQHRVKVEGWAKAVKSSVSYIDSLEHKRRRLLWYSWNARALMWKTSYHFYPLRASAVYENRLMWGRKLGNSFNVELEKVFLFSYGARFQLYIMCSIRTRMHLQHERQKQCSLRLHFPHAERKTKALTSETFFIKVMTRWVVARKQCKWESWDEMFLFPEARFCFS